MANVLYGFGLYMIVGMITTKFILYSTSKDLRQNLRQATKIRRSNFVTLPERFFHTLYILGLVWFFASIPTYFFEAYFGVFSNSGGLLVRKIGSIYPLIEWLFFVISFYVVIMRNLYSK